MSIQLLLKMLFEWTKEHSFQYRASDLNIIIQESNEWLQMLCRLRFNWPNDIWLLSLVSSFKILNAFRRFFLSSALFNRIIAKANLEYSSGFEKELISNCGKFDFIRILSIRLWIFHFALFKWSLSPLSGYGSYRLNFLLTCKNGNILITIYLTKMQLQSQTTKLKWLEMLRGCKNSNGNEITWLNINDESDSIPFYCLIPFRVRSLSSSSSFIAEKQIKNHRRMPHKSCSDSTKVSIQKLGSLISDSLFQVSTLPHIECNQKTKTVKVKRMCKDTKWRETKKATLRMRFNAHKVIQRKYLIFHFVRIFSSVCSNSIRIKTWDETKELHYL